MVSMIGTSKRASKADCVSTASAEEAATYVKQLKKDKRYQRDVY
jgi:sulfite reductase alpha subunit-like flavoprotein